MTADSAARGADHDAFADWDAAYVLGALSTVDRLAFEGHLGECEQCAVAVAEFAGVPGLLGSLPAAEALSLLAKDAGGGTEPVPASILPALTARVRHRRRARSWVVGLGGIAAAAAIVVAVVLPMSLNAPAPPTVSTSLQQVATTPITANVQLTTKAWGTEITMSCTYRNETTTSTRAPDYQRPGIYGLYIVNRAGVATRVSSWTAGPGTTVHTTGSVATPAAEIANVELRALDTDKVLLSRDIR